MIKAKILLFVGLISLMIFTLSAGSLALFGNEVISPGNTINSGTLFIGKEDGCKGVLDKFINLKDLIPGAKPQEIKIKIKNLGSMPAFINGISTNISECNDKFLTNALYTECLDIKGNILYQGSLLSLDGNIVPIKRVLALEPGKSTEIIFKIHLDERAGNWYKGKNVEFSVAIYAGQNPDQKVGERVRLADVGNVQKVLNQANPGDVVLIPAGCYDHLNINVPGVTVKAKDVVFDTVVGGFTVDETLGANSEIKIIDTVMQGFTINGSVEVRTSRIVKVLDNIINSEGKAITVNRSGKVFVTRNDLTQLKKDLFNCLNKGGKVDARYNLGDDLNPEECEL